MPDPDKQNLTSTGRRVIADRIVEWISEVGPVAEPKITDEKSPMDTSTPISTDPIGAPPGDSATVHDPVAPGYGTEPFAELDQGLQEFFGTPPLVEGEDPALFHQMHQRIRATFLPADPIEEIVLYRLVCLSIYNLRLRRVEARLMNAILPGLRLVLRTLVPDSRLQDMWGKPGIAPREWPTLGDNLADDWARGEPEAKNRVRDILKGAGMDRDAILAQTLVASLREIQGIAALLKDGEARFRAELRGLDRRRGALAGRTIRRVVENDPTGNADPAKE